jgi:hypothetical protein
MNEMIKLGGKVSRTEIFHSPTIFPFLSPAESFASLTGNEQTL